MKTAKKIVWVALALLPLLTFVWLFLGQIGQEKSNPLGFEEALFFPIWEDVIITETDQQYYIENLDTGLDVMTLTSANIITFVGLQSAIDKDTVLGAFCGIYNILVEDCRIPCGAPTFFGMLYLFYLAFLEIVSLLIDLILFVPRKCGEIFH